jgi:hypothetical protein
MQIFLTKNHFLLILLILTVFFACGMEEEDTSKLPIQPEPADPVVEPEPILYGTVSGRVTDAITKKPDSWGSSEVIRFRSKYRDGWKLHFSRNTL